MTRKMLGLGRNVMAVYSLPPVRHALARRAARGVTQREHGWTEVG